MKKAKLLSLSLIYLFISSCTKIQLFAVNTAARLNAHYILHKDLIYGIKDRQRLNVFSLKNSSEPKPVVVFFYGGSWIQGDKDMYRFMGEALSSLDMVVVIADYRLYPQVKFPEFVMDGAETLAWVKENISQYGGDPDQVFVMGHSAGAHIAALLSFDRKYLKDVGLPNDYIKGFIGLSGPYDFLPFTSEVNKKIFAPEENYQLSQPIHFVDGKDPRALLIHGRNDRTVGIHNSRNLSQKILKNGGSVETKFYDKLSHTAILGKFTKLLRGKGEILEVIGAFVKSKK